MADFARSADPAVQAALDRLATVSPAGDRLGLDRIARLLDRLGRPQDSLPPLFHVAGTNGKGSTCAFLRAALEQAGHKVHVFTSPHLVRFNERIRIAGQLVTDGQLAALLEEVLAAGQSIQPSFFEVTAAAALLAFARSPADACILEVGLGGRLDATNVVEAPLVCGIAQLALDHQGFLGDSLAEIAGEKAGIAKPGVPLVCLAQPTAAMAAIEHIARIAGAPLLVEGRDFAVDHAVPLGLAGEHQRRNAALAAAMIRAQDRLATPAAAIRDGMANARWPGRLQRLADGPLARGRDILVDGAHNPAAAEALARTLERDPRRLILGILANKDADALVAALAPHALGLTFVPVADHDSHDPEHLAKRWGGTAADSLEAAVAATAGPLLIAGSLYLVGQSLLANRQLPD